MQVSWQGHPIQVMICFVAALKYVYIYTHTHIYIPFLNFKILFIFLKLFIFTWRIIVLQYCAGFCQTSTWTSHRSTCASSLLNLPSNTHSVQPLFVTTEPGSELLHHTANPTGYLFYIWDCTRFHATLSTHPSFSFSHCVLKSSLCLHLHCYPEIGSSVPPLAMYS